MGIFFDFSATPATDFVMASCISLAKLGEILNLERSFLNSAKQSALSKFSAEQKVWVGGLTPDVDWKAIETHFNTVAKTKWVEMMKGKMNKCACVVYSTAEEAQLAIATMNGSTLGSATIECDVWARPEREKGGKFKMDHASGNPSGKKELVAKVKTFQKSSADNKQTWYAFCDSLNAGVYDPNKYEEDALTTFLGGVGVAY